jgi:hypothetical protein
LKSPRSKRGGQFLSAPEQRLDLGSPVRQKEHSNHAMTGYDFAAKVSHPACFIERRARFRVETGNGSRENPADYSHVPVGCGHLRQFGLFGFPDASIKEVASRQQAAQGIVGVT